MITLSNAVDTLKNEEPIHITPIYKGVVRKKQMFRVLKDLTIQLSNGDIIIIPKGFKTDLKSVPNILWSIVSPYGDFLLAVIIHDYLYVEDYISQKFADKEMLIWSNTINPHNKIENYLSYWMVRLFGKSVYKK